MRRRRRPRASGESSQMLFCEALERQALVKEAMQK